MFSPTVHFYTKREQTVPPVNSTLGTPEDEYLKIGLRQSAVLMSEAIDLDFWLGFAPISIPTRRL